MAGYLAEGQKSVLIKAKLQDEFGYDYACQWGFSLPGIHADTISATASAKIFAVLAEQYIRHLERIEMPVIWAVCDPELERNYLINRWEQQFPGHYVNLDHIMHKIGIGRYYSAEQISAEKMRKAIEEGDRHTQNPLLVGPIDETLHRLLGDEAPGVLESWLHSLRDQGWGHTGSRLIFLLSSGMMNKLRRHDLSGTMELAFHRPHVYYSGDVERLNQNIVDWAQSRLSVPKERVEALCEALAWDLRLLNHYLKLESSLSLSEFLKNQSVSKLLIAELSALPPLDLLSLLLGAVSESQIIFKAVHEKQVAAEPFYSSVRKQDRKLIFEQGERLSRNHLNRVKSDAHTPAHIRVQGFGLSATPIVLDSRLLPIVKSQSESQRLAGFRRLAASGLGEWTGKIFRTASPYREFIQSIYHDLQHLPEEQRDAHIYEKLMGAGRSPVDVINPLNLADLPNESLATLMPKAKPEAIKWIQQFAQAWRDKDGDRGKLLKSLFGSEKVELLEPDVRRWDVSLLACAPICYGVGRVYYLQDYYPESYLFWLNEQDKVDITKLKESALEFENRAEKALSSNTRKNEDKKKHKSVHVPRIIIFGPGADKTVSDLEKRIAVITLTDLFQAAWEGDLLAGFWRKVKVQLRLSAFSPFQTSGALPPGSPVFKGRAEELEFICQRFHRASVLIIGSRRVGKTSLLNQALHRARQQQDIQPIMIDLQGIGTRQAFGVALLAEVKSICTDEQLKMLENTQDIRARLNKVIENIQVERKMPLFLLNEIDLVVKDDPELIQIWRSLNDCGKARFIMVGYSVIAQLGDLEAHLFHSTEGIQFGGKAVALTALNENAAEGVLDLLQEPPLSLRWVSEEERRQAYQLLLQRSYRIPWVLQRYCQLLVYRLEEQVRDSLGIEDIACLLNQEGNVVWEYIEGIDYDRLGYTGQNKRLQTSGFKLVLYALARAKYFQQGAKALIRDPELNRKAALDFSFTIGEAREAVLSGIGELLLVHEKQVLEDWLASLDWKQSFRLLTLTLILEPDPIDSDRFAFLLHIFPQELNRLYGDKDPMLNDLIVQTAIEFTELDVLTRLNKKLLMKIGKCG